MCLAPNQCQTTTAPQQPPLLLVPFMMPSMFLFPPDLEYSSLAFHLPSACQCALYFLLPVLFLPYLFKCSGSQHRRRGWVHPVLSWMSCCNICHSWCPLSLAARDSDPCQVLFPLSVDFAVNKQTHTG